MIPVITSPLARVDIKSFYHYIAKDSHQSADRLLEKIEETHNLISEFPCISSVYETATPELKGMRWIPVKGFPNHLIFYIPEETKITVVRIFHKAQDISSVLI